MDFGKKQPIKWCHKRMGRNKQCPMPLNRKAIDPNGNVCVIALDNGDLGRKLRESPYGMLLSEEKPLKGWVWYDSFGDPDEVIEEREQFIAQRKKVHNAQQNEYSTQFQTTSEKMMQQVLEREVMRAASEPAPPPPSAPEPTPAPTQEAHRGRSRSKK